MSEQTKTDEQVVADRDDLLMLQRPHLWPHVGVLPLKRRGDIANTGYITADKPTRVYLGNLFLRGLSGTFRDYADAQAIVDDGWVVD
jgi:hypothetical protein